MCWKVITGFNGINDKGMLSMGYGEKSTAMLKMIKQDVHNW